MNDHEKDLIERLRRASLEPNEWRWGWIAESIDEIERLTAERDKTEQDLRDMNEAFVTRGNELIAELELEKENSKGNAERARLLLEAKNHWADRAAKAETQRDRLAEALGALMDAVSDMPADADECWPDEWAAARAALEAIK